MRKTLAVAMSNGERDYAATGSARRRRERRLRCFLRHEEMAVCMALARATHHAVQRHQCTQTVAPAPAHTNAAPAPMIEYVAPAIPETVNTNVAPALVIEYIAPSPAVSYPSFYPSFSQPNEAITGLVNPQISITADETSQVPVVVQEIPEIPVVEWIQEQIAFHHLVNPLISTTSVQASHVVASFPLLEDFAARMHNQVHQEQIVATVQQQAIVQENIRGSGCGTDTGTNC